MVDLFVDHVLLKNNRDQDRLDTERELVQRLQNRVLMLFFSSASSPPCQDFSPALCSFYKRLTHQFYVERAAQLVLVYVSLDQSEEEQENVLKELPSKCLFLAFEDPYRRELASRFQVGVLPCVVVLRPDCSVLSWNAVQEIQALGPDCYRNWEEASEIFCRSFIITEEDPQETTRRSLTDPLRRIKYRLQEEEEHGELRKRRKRGEREREEEGGGGGGGAPW